MSDQPDDTRATDPTRYPSASESPHETNELHRIERNEQMGHTTWREDESALALRCRRVEAAFMARKER